VSASHLIALGRKQGELATCRIRIHLGYVLHRITIPTLVLARWAPSSCSARWRRR
jgi:hypothetical protein